MIFDFGPVIEYVQITAQYSNAVLLAIMPHVSDFAKKMELPMPQPVTPAMVTRFVCNPWKNDPGGSINIGNYCTFEFAKGHVMAFGGPHSFFGLQNPDDIPKFFGKVNLTEQEVVEVARHAITNLGYSLESVFAEFRLQVTPPEKVGTNIVPHFRVEWPDPRGGPSVDIDVNAEKKRIERMRLSNRNLERPSPEVHISAEKLPNHLAEALVGRQLNPVYGQKLFPLVCEEVGKFIQRLELNVPAPVRTNMVARFKCEDNGGWPHAILELTNGWRFMYRNTNVCGYYASDDFFGMPYSESRRKTTMKPFLGAWTMTDQEIVDLARSSISKLGYPPDFIHTDGTPTLHKPNVSEQVIPRCVVEWMYPSGDNMEQWIRIEVDAKEKTVKSLYLDDKSFWGQSPSIGDSNKHAG